MKINYVKFFQHVELPIKHGGQTLFNYARGTEYDITLDGILLTIKPVGGGDGDTIISTLNNVQYMKVANDANNKTEKGSLAAGGKKKEQA